MKPLRFGIVGCGGIANFHAECLLKLKNEGLAELTAGAEMNPDTRAKFGEKWGASMVGTLDELVRRDDVDVITVCSPSGLHGDHCTQIARAKKHILCEKPLDLVLSKADAALAAVKENGVVLGGIFQQRFAAGPAKVKRAIEQGFFGDIVLAHCETPWYRSQAYYDSGKWRGTWAMDCGVLSNQSPHMIDRIIWLAGDVDEVVGAAAQAGFGRKIEAETVAAATVRLVNGAIATITATTLAYDGLPQRSFVCGTEGSAAFSGDDLVYFKTARPFEPETEKPAASAVEPPDGENRAGDPFAMSGENHFANIRDFVLALHEGRPPLVGGEDYRRVTRAINLIYEKAGVGPFAKK